MSSAAPDVPGCSMVLTKGITVELDIEQLRCFICKAYLSCGPLRVLQNGNSICGRCSPASNEEPTYRILALETALKKVMFPCRFENEGCLERVLFRHVKHETTCNYQTFACFGSPYGTCTWTGNIFAVMKHFSETHSEICIQEKEFKIDAQENIEQKMFIFEEADVIVIVHYSFNLDKMEFTYYARYLSTDYSERFYNGKLYNEASRSCYVAFKQNALERYQPNIIAPNNETVLNMKSYLEVLGNPNVVVFSIDLTISDAVDYNLLANLKCSLCGIYVIPPIFKRDCGQLLCTRCAEKFKKCELVNDNNLTEMIAEVNYPCKWEQCKIVKKVDSIREHEKVCTFREFYCPLDTCYESYKPGNTKSHFEVYHDYKCFTGNSYVWSFNAEDSKSEIRIFKVKGDEAIAIECTIIDGCNFMYTVKPSCMSSYVKVYFAHDPCKAKIRYFCTTSPICLWNDLCCCRDSINQSYFLVFVVLFI